MQRSAPGTSLVQKPSPGLVFNAKVFLIQRSAPGTAFNTEVCLRY